VSAIISHCQLYFEKYAFLMGVSQPKLSKMKAGKREKQAFRDLIALSLTPR
jgi:hypothetical protein